MLALRHTSPGFLPGGCQALALAAARAIAACGEWPCRGARQHAAWVDARRAARRQARRGAPLTPPYVAHPY